MRSVRVIGGLAICTFIGSMPSACSRFDTQSSDAPSDAGSSDAPSDAESVDGSETPPVDGRTDDGGPSLITVSGKVTSIQSHAPIPNRQIMLIDALGRTQQTMTGTDGGFNIAGVRPPYDVRVAGDTGGYPPTIYLALTSAVPRVVGYVTPLSVRLPRTATVRLALQGPSCGDSFSCDTTITTSSNGANQGAVSRASAYFVTSPNATVDTTHRWSGDPTTGAYLAVLASNRTYTSFWYYFNANVPLTDGQTTNVSTVAPTPVSLAGTATLAIKTIDVPTDWAAPNAQMSLNYATGGFAYLAGADALLLTTGVPNVIGSTLSASASIADPANGQRRAHVQTPPLALNTPSLTLTITAPPLITVPNAGGHLSKSTSIQWTRFGDPSVTMLSIYSSFGGSSAQVFTSKTALDLGKLSSFGPGFGPGIYNVGVEDLRPIANIDALVSTGIIPDSSGEFFLSMTVDP